MNWQKAYESRLTTAEAAVQTVKSGDRVAIPVYTNPTQIAAALANRLHELKGVTVSIGAAATDLAWYHPEAAEAFQIEPWYTSPYLSTPLRQMINERRSDHRVCPSALLCKTLDDGRPDNVPPPDVVLLDVSPPDHMVAINNAFWKKPQKRYFGREDRL